MKRKRANFIIDVLAFLGFSLLLSTGYVLRFVLPPGSGSRQGQGNRPISLLWDMDRHQWGEVHFWIACSLIILIAIHLILHFGWIEAVFKGKTSEPSRATVTWALFGIIAVILLALLPFFSSLKTQTRMERNTPSLNQQNPKQETTQIKKQYPPPKKQRKLRKRLRGQVE